jgi:hypothetical protein
MQETTTPEHVDGAGAWQEPRPADAVNLSDAQEVTYQFTTSKHDPELGVIDVMLRLLQIVPYVTRLRAVRYVLSRVETDPNVWGPEPRPEPGPVRPLASPGDVARALAEADDRDLDTLSVIQKGAYYRRADALLSRMVVEIK